MLKVQPTHDKELLNRLSEEIFGRAFPKGVGYVLYEGSTPLGVADVVAHPEKSEIVSVGILPTERGKGYGDFFTRVIMDRLSGVCRVITAGYTSAYYLKFGFCEKAGKMEIRSSELVFPRACQK